MLRTPLVPPFIGAPSISQLYEYKLVFMLFAVKVTDCPGQLIVFTDDTKDASALVL